MNILVVLEDNNGAIHRMSLEAIVAAQKISSKLKSKITVLAMGRNAEALATEASKYELNDILKINSSSLNSYSSDGYAIAIEQIILENDFRYVFFGHTYQVRDYVPKISAKLMRPFLSDNIKIFVLSSLTDFSASVFISFNFLETLFKLSFLLNSICILLFLKFFLSFLPKSDIL